MSSDWETPKCILCKFLFSLDLHETFKSFFFVNFLWFFIARRLFLQICSKVQCANDFCNKWMWLYLTEFIQRNLRLKAQKVWDYQKYVLILIQLFWITYSNLNLLAFKFHNPMLDCQTVKFMNIESRMLQPNTTDDYLKLTKYNLEPSPA